MNFRMSVTILPSFWMMLSCYTLAPAYQLPDTGIDACYNNSAEIICPAPGEPFYGQDAQHDGPRLSYQDNGNGTVSDLNTGLTWQQGEAGTRSTWQDASDYCEALVLPADGHSDWRLPTVWELMSIVDFGIINPAIETEYFPDCNWPNYWSSTPIYTPNYWWVVYFYYGNVLGSFSTSPNYVRCVRGGSVPTGLFYDIQNGTVADSVTGLTWQKGDAQNGSGRTWEEALEYCEDLSLAGHSDWRLPNVRELMSVVDYDHYNPSIDTDYFPDSLPYYYWSSSGLNYYSESAWTVHFYGGRVEFHFKTKYDSVRCVRGGAGGPPVTPTVTTTAISSITAATASSGGTVIFDGGASVMVKGVCWSTSVNPTIGDSHTTDGTGIGGFTSAITGLYPGTAYHVRAYATNSVGTGYGSGAIFTTAYASVSYVSDSGDCGGKAPCYDSIQTAVDETITGSIVLIAQGVYDESLVLDESKALTLQGGLDSTFAAQSSYTTVDFMTISSGTVSVDSLVIH